MIDKPEDTKEKIPSEEKDTKKPYVIHKTKAALKHLPEKKQYVELVTAVLSVPLMITVLLLNLGNLRKTDTPVTPTPTPTLAVTTNRVSPTDIITVPIPTAIVPTINLSPGVCTKEVGPVEIASPKENETLTQDPICIDITRKSNNYCEVVWSYRINDDQWSEYTDKSICLYNLSSGQKNVEVRVKSIASSDQTVLKRSFQVVKDTPTPTSTTSANLQN